MWTLILMISFNTKLPISVTNIDGFESRQACIQAGDLWLNHKFTSKNPALPDFSGYRTATCVSKN